MAYQIPRGCDDVCGIDSYRWRSLEHTLSSFCYMDNYDDIRIPIFNVSQFFKYEADSNDMVNKES